VENSQTMFGQASLAPFGSVPEQGQLVEVRRRQWVVADVIRSGLPCGGVIPDSARYEHLLTLTSIDEDALGEELRIVWEIEPGARILEKAGLPSLTGFDDPVRLDAFLDAVRWGAATNADVQVLQAPFRSGIAIEEYQLDPLVRALDMPRVNILIADDVGLGKTIEAGLVVQELLLRYRARTVLVVCPASLQLKWKTEMQEKFGLEFRIADTDYIKELRRTHGIHANPWASFPRLITSIDWIKNDIPMRLMRDTLPTVPTYPRRFDILIVDEAHNVAPSGSGNYAVDSLRTKAIRVIAPHFEHRLFLTATPHNGYQESFTSLLEMLDDQRFARAILPDQDNLERIMVRRLKSDIVDQDENPVFPCRKLMPLEIRYTDEERMIHGALAEYTKLRRRSMKEEIGRYATEFVLKLLKKRLFSSPAAFATTLDKHRESLMAQRKKPKETILDRHILRHAIQQTEEDYADDDRREQAESEAVETAGSGFVPLSDNEVNLLDQMTNWVNVAKDRPDSKARAIIEWIKEHIRPKGRWSNERVIIFTEYRATQRWLVDILTAEGLGGSNRLMTLYGGMDPNQRESVKAAFQASPEDSAVRILVATDAASEGIDLQNHCYRMLHVEIPWNPNVLEQRNGRIDRHGQKAKEVLIWHPVGAGYKERPFWEAINTGELEGDLEFLMVAAQKVNNIREDLGKVGPVIARQVEEAMLGVRSRLDTGLVEEQAKSIRKQCPVNRRIRERVERLHQNLIETRETFRLSPENVATAVHVALAIAGQPPLRPVDGTGAPPGAVFEMPALQGTWARCAEGLAHPHTGGRRPITFDHDVAKGRDDVVLVHLNHRLVQMSLRLLRAEVWALEDSKRLHRVTARVVSDDPLKAPAVVVWSRLVVIGAKSHRLHEEVTCAGGLLRNERFTRLTVTQLEELTKASKPAMSSRGMLQLLLGEWSNVEARIVRAVEARTQDRMRYLENTLRRRRDRDISDITNILQELKSSIEREIRESEKPKQLDLWTTDEKLQLQRNKDSLRARIAEIPKEIENERRAIAERYADPIARTFPVAVVFLLPESMARGDL